LAQLPGRSAHGDLGGDATRKASSANRLSIYPILGYSKSGYIVAASRPEAALAKSIYTQQYDVFKELLRQTREDKRLTQSQLSKRLKVYQSRVSKVELGERRMDVAELLAWCEALGITLESFMTNLVALWRKRGLYRGGSH
jgi:hypothetical protein